jgi:hypothetical protein
MPHWAELPPHVAKAWRDAGKAVARKVYEVVNEIEPCPQDRAGARGLPRGPLVSPHESDLFTLVLLFVLMTTGLFFTLGDPE